MQLIPNWKEAHKLWSVRILALGSAITGLVEYVQYAKALGIRLPDGTDDAVMWATLISAGIARVLKQPAVDGE